MNQAAMKLSSFSLNAKDCASLISVQGLGEAVLKMASSLQHVHLNFHGCRDLLFDASMTELKQSSKKQTENISRRLNNVAQLALGAMSGDPSKLFFDKSLMIFSKPRFEYSVKEDAFYWVPGGQKSRANQQLKNKAESKIRQFIDKMKLIDDSNQKLIVYDPDLHRHFSYGNFSNQDHLGILVHAAGYKVAALLKAPSGDDAKDQLIGYKTAQQDIAKEILQRLEPAKYDFTIPLEVDHTYNIIKTSVTYDQKTANDILRHLRKGESDPTNIAAIQALPSSAKPGTYRIIIDMVFFSLDEPTKKPVDDTTETVFAAFCI